MYAEVARRNRQRSVRVEARALPQHGQHTERWERSVCASQCGNLAARCGAPGVALVTEGLNFIGNSMLASGHSGQQSSKGLSKRETDEALPCPRRNVGGSPCFHCSSRAGPRLPLSLSLFSVPGCFPRTPLASHMPAMCPPLWAVGSLKGPELPFCRTCVQALSSLLSTGIRVACS